MTPRESSERLADGKHPPFEMERQRQSVFDANTADTPSQLSMEPNSALAFSEDTLPQHDEDRFDYQSRHRNPAYTESWNSGGNVERDVEKEGGEGDNQRQEQKNDPNLIEWNGPDDPGNPMNWSSSKKWIVTMALAFMTFCITFASSVFSTATQVTAKEYGVSTEVTTLGTSLFVLVNLHTYILFEATGGANWAGLRGRTIDLGTLFRALWTYDPSILRVCNLRHLPGSRGCCSESSYHLDLSIFRRSLWVCSPSNCRRCIGRFLGSRRPRYRYLPFLSRHFHWSSRWSYCWWFHYDELSRLAVDCVDHSNYGRAFLDHWPHSCPGDICTCAVTTKGKEDPL